MNDEPQTFRDVESVEEILGADDQLSLRVVVPEWRCAVYLRMPSAGKALALSREVSKLSPEQQEQAPYMLISACLARADGKLLFGTPKEAEQLATRSIAVVDRLQKLVIQFLGWGDGAQAEGKGSSATTVTGASPTA